MPITSTWTTPSTLDLAVGNVLPEANWDNLVSNTLYLWDTVHNYARAAQVLSMTIGASDVNLYRGGADILKTDDAFATVASVFSHLNTASQIQLADKGGGVACVFFGSAADVNLYRSAADILKTDDHLIGSASIHSYDAASAQISLTDKGSGEAVIFFGAAADTNLYRASANQLRTDDSLDVVGTLTAPNVMTRLAEAVLGSTATSITFSSIPATYRHLRLVMSVRGDVAVNQLAVYMRLNGDASAIYSYENHQAEGPNNTAARVTGQTEAIVMYGPGATALASEFANGEIVIPVYKTTDRFKSWMALSVGINGTSNIQANHLTGMWASTAAITSITIYPSVSSFVAGTTMTLYGDP